MIKYCLSATATYLDEARNVVNKGFASRKGGLLHHYYTILEEFWYSENRLVYFDIRV